MEVNISMVYDLSTQMTGEELKNLTTSIDQAYASYAKLGLDLTTLQPLVELKHNITLAVNNAGVAS